MVLDGFASFYEHEYLRARRLAHLLTGQPSVADDLAQQAMMRVRRHYDGLENPTGYLRTTVVNVCRNWFRAQARERWSGWRSTRRGARPSRGPKDVEGVLRAIDALSYRQRAVIVLRYWLDPSKADIAEHLGCRRGTVKSLSSRALARLRQELP